MLVARILLFAYLIVADTAVDAEGVDNAAVEEELVMDGFSKEEHDKMEESAEKHEFQAEVNRLMDIIINSLYTDKTVFLRELISNAADALEKCRFYSVQDETFLGDTKDLEIKIEFNEAAKTLSITDTGIGMTKADLINNLGTVAKSGTSNFLEAMQEGGDSNLIGQFGVGFYSAFLVADKVAVTSKNNDDETQHIWESSADASFSIMEDPRGTTLGRGSRITLHLKEDALEFLSESKLKDLSKKFSQFIQFPIYVKTKKEVDADGEDEDDEDESSDDEEGEDKDKDKEKKDKKGTKKIVYEWEQINTQKAIWMRSKDEVKHEEYVEFYKGITKEYTEPLTYSHFSAEGEIEFKSILFVPKKAPADMMDNYWTKKAEIKLFVRRVLVAEKFEELLPRYLNFLKGVVDSDDLPLNVSREQLQQNKIMKVISKKLVRKSLEMLKKIGTEKHKADDDDDEEEKKDDSDEEKKKEMEANALYMEFWKEFGKQMKMGCYEDDSNRSKIAKLLRFHTTIAEGEDSLDSYLDRMKEKQNEIYYATGDTLDSIRKQPALQMFRKKGIEVLMLQDNTDEPCLQKLSDYEGKKFMSVQKADVTMEETDDEKKFFARLEKHYKPLTDWFQEHIKDLTSTGGLKDAGIKVDTVKLSKRLVDSPCVVVSGQFGHSAQQEKLMRAQGMAGKDMSMMMMMGGKTLEVNPNHPVVKDMLVKVNNDKTDKALLDSASIMFQTALIESGWELTDPTYLVKKVYGMMSSALGVDPDAQIEDVELPEEEEEPEKEEEEEEDEEEVEVGAEKEGEAEGDKAEEGDEKGEEGEEEGEEAEEGDEAEAEAEAENKDEL